MRKEYDFTNSAKNPYSKKLKTQITINISNEVIEYFKNESTRTGIPYQTLINLYLLDCVKEKRQLSLTWK